MYILSKVINVNYIQVQSSGSKNHGFTFRPQTRPEKLSIALSQNFLLHQSKVGMVLISACVIPITI